MNFALCWKVAALASVLSLTGCMQGKVQKMTAVDFCALVVDPQFASRTRVRLESRSEANYQFSIRRPAAWLRVEVPRSELEVRNNIEQQKLPIYVPFDSLRVRSIEGASGSCTRWFP
jgi:hypothetical protein